MKSLEQTIHEIKILKEIAKKMSALAIQDGDIAKEVALHWSGRHSALADILEFINEKY